MNQIEISGRIVMTNNFEKNVNGGLRTRDLFTGFSVDMASARCNIASSVAGSIAAAAAALDAAAPLGSDSAIARRCSSS